MRQPQQRYRVLERVAAGGMAEVFRAESAGLEGFKKTVAIKRVLPHLSQKKEFIGMFLDEARLSAALSHSNVVQVFDIGVGDDTYFIVMEYVDGANLKSVVEHRKQLGRPLPIEVACLISLRACEGLAYAHEAMDALGQPLGIVHRDVSPPNVLITRHGEVKVVDFGLAKANSQLEASQPGIIKGKFSYLSPEAALGEEVDQRTDIFATGIILWEMITGTRLFLGETDLGTVRQVQAARVPPLAQYVRDVPPQLERIMGQALARDKHNRYQTARDFARDLNGILFQMGRPVSSFEIGALVGDVREEQRRQKGTRPKQQTLIGSLIQDAIMSFRSLTTEDRNTSVPSPDEQSGVGAIPLSFGTFEGSNSGARVPAPEPSGLSFGPSEGSYSDRFQAGNLAALEDPADAPAPQPPPRLPPGRKPRPSRQPKPSANPGYDPALLAGAQGSGDAVPAQKQQPQGLPPQAPGQPELQPQGLPGPAHMTPPGPARLPVTYWVVTATLVAVGAAVGAYLAGVFS